MLLEIDWQQVLEKGIWIVPTAVVGLAAGMLAARPRPKVRVVRCGICAEESCLVSLISIPPEIVEQVSGWLGEFSRRSRNGQVPAAELHAAIQTLRQDVEAARSVLPDLRNKVHELKHFHDQPTLTKLEFVAHMLHSQRQIIGRSINGILVRRELELPVPDEETLRAGGREPLSRWEAIERADGGFRIRIHDEWRVLRSGFKEDDPLLLPAVRALCWFHIPSLQMLFERVEGNLTRLAAEGDDVVGRLERVLREAQPVVVEVHVVNYGSRPASFTPNARAVLSRRTGAGAHEIPLARLAPRDPGGTGEPREPSLVVVQGGATEPVRYCSVRPVAKLAEDVPAALSLFDEQELRCRVRLERADQSARRTWLQSKQMVLARSGGHRDPSLAVFVAAPL